MITGIIGAAAGAANGIFGGISKNKMLKEQMKMLNEQKRENQDWYDRRYNEDSTQRADAQAMLTKTAEMIKQRNQQAAGTAAVMGGTEESTAAAKEANAQALADATSQIVVAGEQRKSQIENQYMDKKAALDEQLRALQGQKKDGFAMASDAIAGAFDGFSKGMGMGGK
jgi:hypothetical protein